MLILVAMLCLQFFFSFFVCRRRFLSWIRIRLAHKGDFVCPYYYVVVLLSFFCKQHSLPVSATCRNGKSCSMRAHLWEEGKEKKEREEEVSQMHQ